jgi:hypothetical protein
VNFGIEAQVNDKQGMTSRERDANVEPYQEAVSQLQAPSCKPQAESPKAKAEGRKPIQRNAARFALKVAPPYKRKSTQILDAFKYRVFLLALGFHL